eukprot:Skav226084  [mRNA]  locus=scaffold211:1035822:1044527:- [translate_table: standard]
MTGPRMAAEFSTEQKTPRCDSRPHRFCSHLPLLRRLRRRQSLSPLVPAEAVLRAFPEATRAALLVLAEHTLTTAACGSAAVWAVRDQRLLLTTSQVNDELRSFSLCLRPGDLIVLAAEGHQESDANLLKMAMDPQPAMPARVMRPVLQHGSDAWSPLKEDRPHPSWVKTVFNE